MSDVFIITHGRPNNQSTYNVLRSCGYTGNIYFVLDDEDDTVYQYQDNFGDDNIIVFSKSDFITRTDFGLYTPYRKFAVFARNAVEYIAKNLGLDIFWVFDDDVTSFRLRYVSGESLKSHKIHHNLDKIFSEVEYFITHTNVNTVGFGTANNYMSGVKSVSKESSKYRMCYNGYLRKTECPVEWSLNMCEDRITSLLQNKIGNIWMQLLCLQIDTLPIGGVVDGGNSDVYRNMDKFHQVFFPVMTSPDCNYTKILNGKWFTMYDEKSMCPKIISSKYKRG